MIIRVVKMVFREEEIASFQQLFAERQSLIRHFEGCTHLELWQDARHKATFFTYSWWDSEEHLDNYRSSHFFDDTWKQTKEKFAQKPEAWTVQSVASM
jgi:heme oxygenase (mycobilin-producing)